MHRAKHRPSWTEILNANFISIVPSSTRILYIVRRTGVFTTHTKLNRGLRLRLQRGPELDGDLERELLSPVAVLWLRQQIVVALHWHHTLVAFRVW